MSRFWRVVRSERGFTMVEVLVALTLLGFAGSAFAITSGSGLELVGTAEARQAAVQVANQSIEEARGYPVENLALPSGTAFAGTGTPDVAVTGGGTTYTASVGPEPLVFADGSSFVHVVTEDVDGVRYGSYRYVTWVADGPIARAYKRVTVVVQWTTSGGTEQVTMSSNMTTESVAWATTSTTTPGPTTTTTAGPTTSTTAMPTTSTTANACSDDRTAPAGTVRALAGTGADSGYTASRTVTLSMTASDSCSPVRVSFSSNGTSWTTAAPFTPTTTYTVPSGDGTKPIHVAFIDGSWNYSIESTSIIYDGSVPTTPGSFAVANHEDAPRRQVVSWKASNDTHLAGYRVHKRTATGAFVLQTTIAAGCSSCSYTDTSIVNGTAYSWYVVAYDRAGNVSSATATITRTG